MRDQELFRLRAPSAAQQIHTAEPQATVWKPAWKLVPLPKTVTIMMSIFTGLFLLTFALIAVTRRQYSGAWILFASDRDDDASIYMMTSDGRNQRLAPDNIICAAVPMWTVYGGWNTFINTCDRAGHSMRMYFRSKGLNAAYSLPTSDDRARWSPDRERAVVMRIPSSLYILQVNDGSEHFLAADYYFPQWSPDDEWIYARPIFRDESSLDRIHVATGQVEPLLPPDRVFTNLSWSSEATQIVFAMPTESDDELFLAQADGGDLNQIPVDLPEQRVVDPRWSPDGAWIAFLGGDTPTTLSLYRIRPDGRDLERLTQNMGTLFELQWSSDGKWLLFVKSYEHGSDIIRVRADGSIIENLSSGMGNNHSPQYAPVSGEETLPPGLFIAALGTVVVLITFHRGQFGS